MGKNLVSLLLTVLILLLGCSSASATPAAKTVCGVVTNVVSALFKWLVSLKSEIEPAISSRSMMKFESGYNVETIFDGNKLGVEPYTLEVSPAGEVFILDSENNNIYKISTPHSLLNDGSADNRPTLVTGSPEGCSGHVDGKLREARMNHPKGLATDDSGNIYVADTMNVAIRKISYTGVVTIAGGKRFQGERHIDRPSEDAKLSNDFDVVYVRSSCSLLVIDRGNRAIREIELHKDDCSYQYDSNLHLGAALLFAACFFGYTLAPLQHRIGAIFSSNSEPRPPTRGMPQAIYQWHTNPIQPLLVPTGEECKKPEENVFVSMGRLLVNTGSTLVEIFGGMFSGFRKKRLQPHIQQNLHYSHKHSSSWSMKECYAIDHGDELQFFDPRDPPPRTAYLLMAKDLERTQHFRQSQPDNYGGRNGDFHQHQQVQQTHHHQKKQSSSPRTYIEQSCQTNEVVFGVAQEQDGFRESMVIKTVDYSDPAYNHYNIRSRYNCNMGSFYGY